MKGGNGARDGSSAAAGRFFMCEDELLYLETDSATPQHAVEGALLAAIVRLAASWCYQ